MIFFKNRMSEKVKPGQNLVYQKFYLSIEKQETMCLVVVKIKIPMYTSSLNSISILGE